MVLPVVAHEEFFEGRGLADRDSARPARPRRERTAPIWSESTSRSTLWSRDRTRLWTPASPLRLDGSRSTSAEIVVRVRWRNSAMVPLSTMRPARTMLIRSHRASTSARMWLANRTVRPVLSILLDAHPELGLHQRIEPSSRLVENQEFDVEARAATRATFWRFPLEYVRPFLVGSRSKRWSSCSFLADIEPAAKPTQQVDHLATGQVGPQRHVTRHVGESPMEFGGVGPGITAEQTGGSAVGPNEAEKYANRGGFAGPVGAEKTVDLPSGNLQVEPVEGDRVAVSLHQPATWITGSCHCHALSSSGR